MTPGILQSTVSRLALAFWSVPVLWRFFGGGEHRFLERVRSLILSRQETELVQRDFTAQEWARKTRLRGFGFAQQFSECRNSGD